MGGAVVKPVSNAVETVLAPAPGSAASKKVVADAFGEQIGDAVDTLKGLSGRSFKRGVGVVANVFGNELNERVALNAKSGLGEHREKPLNYIGSAQGVSPNVYNAVLAGVSGGCCGMTGGSDVDVATVQKYAESYESEAKKRIIAGILAVADRMKISTAGSTLRERVQSVRDSLPKSINSATETQRKMCDAIATVINKELGYSAVVVGDPSLTCQQVQELLMSLSAGAHIEFLRLRKDLTRILRNLNLLEDVLGKYWASLKASLAITTDPEVRQKATAYEAVHDVIVAELRRQTEMVNNIVQVDIEPAQKELSELLKHVEITGNEVRVVKPGDADNAFGKLIAAILNQTAIVPLVLDVIDQALKRAGMKMSEYGAIRTRNDFTARVAELMKNIPSDDTEFFDAVQILSKNFDRRESIAAAAMSEARSGSFEVTADAVTGGAYRPTRIEKQIAVKSKVRQLIFKTFTRDLFRLFDAVAASVHVLSKKVGKEVPLSEQLDGFRNMLGQMQSLMSNLRTKGYYALTGYYSDALSRDVRESFIARVRSVISYIDSIAEMSLYASSKQYFTDIKAHLSGILSLIDVVTREVAAKVGSAEASESEKFGAAECGCMGKKGGVETNAAVLAKRHGTTFDPEETEFVEPAFRSLESVRMVDSINEFDYNIRAAQIRRNLHAAERGVTEFTAGYAELVKNSLGEKLRSLQAAYEAERAEIEEGVAAATTTRAEADAQLEFAEIQWAARKKFWATVEAVDKYMQTFTDGVLRHPDDIKDIKMMLDEVKTIDQWYDNETGDNIARAFDQFPHTAAGGPLGAATQWNKSTHTTYVEHATANPDAIGDPSKGTPLAAALESRKLIGQAFSRMASLKNFMSVFVHVGSKFGGEEISKKVFMTPGQMYHNIVDYIQTCCFARNNGLATMRGVAADRKSPSAEIVALKDTIIPTLGDINMSGARLVAQATAAARDANIPAAGTPDRRVIIGAINGLVTAADDAAAQLNATATSVNAAVVAAAGAITSNVARAAVNAVTAAAAAAAAAAAVQPPNLHSLVEDLTDQITINAAKAYAVTMGPSLDAARNIRTRLSSAEAGFLNAVEDIVRMVDGLTLANLTQAKNAISAAITRIVGAPGAAFAALYASLWSHAESSVYEEDKYLVMMLKAMAAKIFTVTGLYDLMDRPHEMNSINPIRMILGGAGTVPVDPECTELYLRLPLLLQFYRRIFDYDDPYSTDAYGDNKFTRQDSLARRFKTVKISMVPDWEGTYAGIIKLMFRDIKGEITMLHDDQVQAVIAECNAIWQKSKAKYPQDTLQSIITEVINEVNRRYGIVSKEERDLWEQNFGLKYDYASETSGYDSELKRQQSTEIALLPGEEDLGSQAMSSAEQMLAGDKLSTNYNSKTYEPAYNVSSEHYNIVKKFRCAIDKHFSDPDPKYSFKGAIRQVRKQLSVEKDAEKRVGLIAGLMKSRDMYSRVDQAKVLVFHETVISGLNALSMLYTIVSKFVEQSEVQDIYAHYVNLIKSGAPPANSTAALPILTKTLGPLGQYFISKLKDPTNLANDASDDQKVQAMGINTNQFAVVAFSALNAARMKAVFPTTEDAALAGDEVAMRDLINNAGVMESLLQRLLQFSGDTSGLVKFEIVDGNLSINWSALKSLIESMFANVSHFIEATRMYIGDEIMRKYTDKKVVGSYYWLQEQFMDKLIVGRKRREEALTADMTVLSEKSRYTTVDDAIRMCNNTWIMLNRKFTGAEPRLNYANQFAKLAFYDNSTHGDLKTAQFLSNTIECCHFGGQSEKLVLDTRFIAHYSQLYDLQSNLADSERSSALFMFNQLLVNYLNTMFDGNSRKIYINAVAGIATHFANALGNPAACFPDTMPLLAVNAESPVAVKLSALNVVLSKLNADGRTAYDQYKADLDANRADVTSANLRNPMAPGLQTLLVNPLFAAGTVNASWELIRQQFPFTDDLVPGGPAHQNRSDLLAAYAAYARQIQGETAAVQLDLFQKLRGAITSTGASTNMPNEKKRTTVYLKYDDAISVPTGIIPAATIQSAGVYLSLADGGAGSDLYVSEAQITGSGDVRPTMVNFNDPTHILYASIADILKNIMSCRSASGVPHYALDSLVDVPQYMKERMRGQLPHFKQLFAALASKCDTLRKLLTKTVVNIGAGAANGVQAFPGNLVDRTSADNGTRKARFVSVLDQIHRASVMMQGTCDQVLREVGDEPAYFEIYSGSIKDYVAANGRQPLSLISPLLAGRDDALPIQSLGDTEFKYNFATRAVLAGAGPASVGGFKELIDMFNTTADSKLAIDAASVDKFVAGFVSAARFVNNARYEKVIIGGSELALFIDGAVDVGNKGTLAIMNRDMTGAAASAGKMASSSWVLRNDRTMAQIVDLAESPQRDEKVKMIVEDVIATGPAPTTASAEVQNIVDMNIIPINVHALARDIPLVNLYNYSYTMERLIMRIFYGSYADTDAKERIKKLCDGGFVPASTKDLFVQLLVEPFTDLGNAIFRPTNQSDVSIRWLMTGATSSQLGRPKFLSDQLWAKALMGDAGVVPDVDQIQRPVRGFAPTYEAKALARLNTVFCRDLIFITSLYRVVRLHLSQQLTYSKEIIRAASSITDWKLTEFEMGETVPSEREKADTLVGHY